MEVTQKLLYFALLSTQKLQTPIIGEEMHKTKEEEEEAAYVSIIPAQTSDLSSR